MTSSRLTGWHRPSWNPRRSVLLLVDGSGVLDTQPSDGNPARDTGPRNDSGPVWDRLVPGLGQQGGMDGLPCSRPRGGQDGLLVFPYSRRGRKMGLASTTWYCRKVYGRKCGSKGRVTAGHQGRLNATRFERRSLWIDAPRLVLFHFRT